eukprot:scaffold319248_cov44-Prasinocladus_malaysianus.AAC.3
MQRQANDGSHLVVQLFEDRHIGTRKVLGKSCDVLRSMMQYVFIFVTFKMQDVTLSRQVANL